MNSMNEKLDTSFSGFNAANLSFDNNMVLYSGVPVVAASGSNLLKPGDLIDGRKINSKQAISLWQQSYYHARKPFDPEECARVYRNVNKVCHRCCGDGVITQWKKTSESKKRVPVYVPCLDCDSTGVDSTLLKPGETC